MTAYWINTFRSVSDPERVTRYAELARPAMRAAGGRFLARGRPVRVFEGGLEERTVVIEFASVDDAVAAYESAAYQEALAVLGDAAERDLRIVEGTESAKKSVVERYIEGFRRGDHEMILGCPSSRGRSSVG